jgi:hypothetical protein
LKVNRTLTELWLGSNIIGAAGVRALRSSVRSGCTLLVAGNPGEGTSSAPPVATVSPTSDAAAWWLLHHSLTCEQSHDSTSGPQQSQLAALCVGELNSTIL